ncbi:MAG: cryptochrome/photolyase family protein, partial [Paracoccaceae bacterium]|nr:cryptochrome/photolyase family protein [Paracoccaceae bacterium]
MVEKLILILGDQLTEDISSLRELDPGKDVIIMAEVLGEASYVAHHPKKIILIFSAMRSFSDKLRSLGYRVEYSFFDDPQNT